MEAYTCEQLSKYTWKVVENDPYGQYPFLYVILGEDKCIIIDSGCGTSDFCGYVSTHLNKGGLPYLVISTHVHFDHVGGNAKFQNSSKCLGVCMGSNNKTFSENYEINSLALAHGGAKVAKFNVTQWLNEGDFIYLNDKEPTKEKSLEVIFTPGHTPDSIALYAHFERRLFVGDSIYPFTAIHLDCIGSNVNDYIVSLKKLIKFIASLPQQQQDASSSSSSEPTTPQTEQHEVTLPPLSPAPSTPSDTKPEVDEQLVSEFLNIIGLDRQSVNFSVEGLLTLCDKSLETAVNMYLSSPGDVESMCPPVAIKPSPASTSSPVKVSPPPTHNGIMLSCGHVEANLPPSTLQQMLDMLSVIAAKALPPAYVDGEFTYDNLTVLMPMKAVNNLSL